MLGDALEVGKLAIRVHVGPHGSVSDEQRADVVKPPKASVDCARDVLALLARARRASPPCPSSEELAKQKYEWEHLHGGGNLPLAHSRRRIDQWPGRARQGLRPGRLG